MMILIHVYTWALPLGTLTASQRNIFDSETLLKVFLVLLMGFELESWNVKSDALPIEPPRHPY